MTQPGYFSLPSTITKPMTQAGFGYVDDLENDVGYEEEPSIERVESGDGMGWDDAIQIIHHVPKTQQNLRIMLLLAAAQDDELELGLRIEVCPFICQWNFIEVGHLSILLWFSA
ncbi:Uncharacterized protein Fot_18354 [Forsythia ovata]|uniref:Uncharacterized protein n=1 Tax=Forsythia ovata TaxID=205694 RepID=A0ABD1VJD4_9LAMI